MTKNIATIIITIISFILIIIAASSCSLEKRLAKYCPLCVQKDSTITVIQVRDTTITIPGETITLLDTLYCDSLGNVISKLIGDLRDKDGTLVSLQTKLQNNVYYTKVKVDTIYKTIKGNDVYHTRVVTKTLKPEKIKYIPWWVNFFAVLGVILFIILLVYFGYKLIKLYLL
jgi:hypothetical protein